MAKANEWELLIHQRLLDGDPTASSEIMVGYLDPLLKKVRAIFGHVRDRDLIYDAVIDALLNYAEHPSRFDPEQRGLLGYLTMSARGDVLNALDRQERRNKHEVAAESVELPEKRRNSKEKHLRKSDEEGERAVEQVLAGKLMERVKQVVTDPRDQELLRLMLEGERKTTEFAKILGLEGLSKEEQARRVKQNKDRIKQRLKRMGVKV